MSERKQIIVLIIALAATVGILGASSWFFLRPKDGVLTSSQPQIQTTPQPSNSANPDDLNSSVGKNVTSSSPFKTSDLNLDASLPNPIVLEMDGSTSMVVLVKELRNAFTQVNPNIPSTFGLPDGSPGGSSKGLKNLIDNKVAIAASSRALKPAEAQAGIQVIPIAKDAIAIVVGIDKPFKGGLTLSQLRDIYTASITNWSQVGGSNLPIRVINRAKSSGTHDFFKDVVLVTQQFAPDGSNFITWPQDETTAILRDLGKDGISYATVSQVEKQEIVRIVTIDDVAPTDITAVKSGRYPITRNLFLAVRKQISPAAKQFIELALSPQGQQIAKRIGFIPL